MKKVISFISVLAACSAMVFADITAKKLDDGSVEATFFYGNPRATEVLLAGDFTNWQAGALPMEKGEKGFSLTKTFPKGTTVKYKFIVDGSWTTDLKAPDFVDDGFGGKNSLGELDAVAGGGDAAASGRSSIKFMTWTMLGSQARFLTQSGDDATKKGMDFNDVTVGAKSYAKFSGNVTPQMPVYVELAVAETELDDTDITLKGKNKPITLYSKDKYGNKTKSFRQGISGLASSPLAWFGKATDNTSIDEGPGTNPYLGHLKLGFETPWINYGTGFNYAKQDKRAKILWTTIDGNWDAGYEHTGGYASFSTGTRLQELFADKGVKLDAGFVPNKSADRKGSKYGYIGWFGTELEDLGLTVDFQSNGMYNGDTLFDEAVEYDYILGMKEKLNLTDAGSITFAVQGLFAAHKMTSDEINAMHLDSKTGKTKGVADYFGYSTDVFYRSGDNGANNMAGEAKVSYDAEEKAWGVSLDYRMRGPEASMLFLRENHDDGTFDLSETLGVLNSQNIGLSGYANLLDDALYLELNANAALPLKHIEESSDIATKYYAEKAWGDWYERRFGDNMAPLFGIKGGSEISADPSVSYLLNDDMSITFNAGVKYNAYKYDDDSGDPNNYSASDSAFLFNNAGIELEWNDVSDVIKSVNLYYGLDNSNDYRLFNTLVASVTLPMDFKLSAAFGIKTVKSTDAVDAYDKANPNATVKDINNMFAFALGVSKQIKRIKSPILYAQFVYNMDPYKKFGDGQDQLNLTGANINSRWDSECGAGSACVDAVDFFDGYAAIRGGIRWEF